MAIHNEIERHMGAAHVKEIDDSAIELIMSNLQRSQYQFPIKSTVREITANGVDSVSEKGVAKLILTGKAKVEDFFVDREGAVYRDSKFDPSYYDLRWLSNDDKVRITYHVGENMQKDKVIITDNGVGLGGRRLEKYFSLGFSTKRLSKLPLGKFGIGAKAPLSVGNDFYTMESRYNGQKFRFNIYNRTVDSIIPRFNLESGRENQFVLFNAGTDKEYKVYWEPTEEKNGVSVYVEAKKTHKQQYVEAVKSQLLYFDNVELTVTEHGQSIVVPHKATILYEDDHIVLSDNPYYSKPHLLLNKVSYGYIDWDELELQDIKGNIGIKVAPEMVDVNPSRESINWSDQTKETVLNKLGTVEEIATRFVNEELQERDFWKWMKTCFTIGNSRLTSNNNIISRLAKVVDIAQLKPIYSKDSRIRFSRELIDFSAAYVSYKTINNKNLQKKLIDRSEIKSLGTYINTPLVLRDYDERASNRKDKYLLSLYPEGFILMTEPGSHVKYKDKPEEWEKEFKSDKSISNAELWELLLQSQDALVYDAIEVPKDFHGTEEEEEDKEEATVEEIAEAKVAQQTAEERRKIEGKIIVHTPRATAVSATIYSAALKGFSIKPDSRVYEWQQIEVPIKKINDWEAEEIYYARQDEDELVQFTAMLTRDSHVLNQIGNTPQRSYAVNEAKWMESKWYRLNQDPEGPQYKTGRYYVQGVHHREAFRCQHFFDAKVMIVKASQANQKYLRDFRPIQQFFIRIQDNTITMSNTLIQWNTARILKDKLASAAFLYNFEQFNPRYAQLYKELTKYVDTHYREVEKHTGTGFYGLNAGTYSDLVSHLDNVQKFQEYVAANSDDVQTIAVMAGQLFGNKELKDGMAVDPDMIVKLEQVQEFATGCGTMLNHIPALTGYMYQEIVAPAYAVGRVRPTIVITEELEQEIKLYLEYKGMLTDYDTTLPENVVAPVTTMVPSEKVEELQEAV